MKRCILLGAAVVFALGMASQASAATIYSQSNLLRGNDTGNNCGGANHGKCTIYEVAAVGTSATANNDIKVSCSLRGAPANSTFQVFWTCTTVARGCHNQACGFVQIGNLVTGSTGAGKFTTLLGNNPFPGNYVHFDILGAGQTYTSVYAGIPIGTGPAAPAAASAGDPTQ